jgi:glycosyltransferase involved in cell wall biosynthesis
VVSANVNLERRRVLVVVPGFPGVDDPLFVPAVSETVAALAKIAEVRVLSLFHPSPPGSYPWRDLVVHSCGVPPQARWLRRWVQMWGAVRQAVRMGREMGCDSVLGVGAIDSGLVATRVARSLGVPSNVHVAGGELVCRPDIPYGDSRDWVRRRIVKRVMASADRLLVGSRTQRAMVTLVGGIGLDKVRTTPFGIRDERFMPIAGERADQGAEETLRILAVAGVLPVKGLATLVAAIALLRERPISLRIVGAGVEEERLLRLAHQWGVADRVEIVGFVEHGRLPEFHRSASLFVQTSHWESQGIALLEAMASGVPAISTPVGIAPEVFDAVGTGRLVPSNNPPALAEAIGDVQRSLSRTSRAAVEASSVVLDRYGVDRCAADLLDNLMM